jgi:hypothetical protein
MSGDGDRTGGVSCLLYQPDVFGVAMLGRRRHDRFEFMRSPHGVMRLPRAVAVRAGANGTLTAVGEAGGLVGDVLTLDVDAGHLAASFSVEVLERRAELVEGVLRPALELRVRTQPAAD